LRNVLRIAHRMPTTKAACSALLAAGANVFEVDVQFAGQAIVVSHYLPFPGSRGRLHHDNWRFRWGRMDGRDPQLAAQLAAVPDGTQILLDPKDPVRERRVALIDAIIDTLGDRDRFLVSTGGVRDLERLHEAGFRTLRSIGDRATLRRVLGSRELSDEIGADGVSVRHNLLDQATVAALHEQVRLVVAWTVNRVARAEMLRRSGVDGVTTDSVDVLRALSGG
jgi:glycerophosphoryl diester phosphodiesterase